LMMMLVVRIVAIILPRHARARASGHALVSVPKSTHQMSIAVGVPIAIAPASAAQSLPLGTVVSVLAVDQCEFVPVAVIGHVTVIPPADAGAGASRHGFVGVTFLAK